MKSKYTNKFALSAEPTERYLISTNVATCENCEGRKAKKRVLVKDEPVFCPDCGHALYWERLGKESKRSYR